MRRARRIDDMEAVELAIARLRFDRKETPTTRSSLETFALLQLEVDKFSESLRDLEVGDTRKVLTKIAAFALRAMAETT